VEFRPVFDDLRKDILHGIISATLIVHVRSAEPNPELQRISFQLDAADVQTLSSELERLKRKVDSLRLLVPRDVSLLNPSKSLEEPNGN
jgi:hypothetical protein